MSEHHSRWWPLGDFRRAPLMRAFNGEAAAALENVDHVTPTPQSLLDMLRATETTQYRNDNEMREDEIRVLKYIVRCMLERFK